MINNFKGCIYGLAIGDALGAPVEFLNIENILRKYGQNGITDFTNYMDFGLGTYTDDTQMSVAIARALIESGHEDLETIMHTISTRFVEWLDSPENNRAPGRVCISGCFRLKKGLHWSESGGTWSKGCGSAMRSAPIGLFFYDDSEKLIEVAKASSIITHRHPTAQAAAVGTAFLVALAINKTEPDMIIDELCKITEKISLEFVEKIRQVNKVLASSPIKSFKILGDGWVGEEAVACALYCFLKSPRDYRKTVLTAVNCNGDSDSIGCIAGAISGAYNGIENIPQKWNDNVENSKFLCEIAEKLYQSKMQK